MWERTLALRSSGKTFSALSAEILATQLGLRRRTAALCGFFQWVTFATPTPA